MSACVVTTQAVITLLASWSGGRAGAWGRKPLLLIAFGVLPIRGVLYTLTSNTVLLVMIQILDGVGAGIFGVVSVLVIADLTRGTGRFNLTLGVNITNILNHFNPAGYQGVITSPQFLDPTTVNTGFGGGGVGAAGAGTANNRRIEFDSRFTF